MWARRSLAVTSLLLMVIMPAEGKAQVTQEAQAGPDCNEKCARYSANGDWGYACVPTGAGEGEGVSCVASATQGCNFGENCPPWGAFAITYPTFGILAVRANRSCSPIDDDPGGLPITSLADPPERHISLADAGA